MNFGRGHKGTGRGKDPISGETLAATWGEPVHWRTPGIDPTSGERLSSAIGRRNARPDRRAVVGSVTFHVVLTAGLIVSGWLYSKQLPEYVTYQVTLYSPPPVVEGPPEPAPIESRIVTPPRPDPPQVTQPPRPVTQQTTPPPVEEPPPPDPKPPAGERPDPESQGGENLDIDIAGADFPYPTYLDNIIVQLHRYFRWSGNPRLSGTVVFLIQRDGSAGSLQVLVKSGDFNFDLRMLEAVEQASRRGAFGPLPDGWVAEVLPVRFEFKPQG